VSRGSGRAVQERAKARFDQLGSTPYVGGRGVESLLDRPARAQLGAKSAELNPPESKDRSGGDLWLGIRRLEPEAGGEYFGG
jgi:hypothetical protein